MAKNSFLFGQTRGAVGNVVVRQQAGRTVVSAKPQQVSNPRTYAQAENRMRLAAVSKFYSPLSSVLEQAWQGKTTQQSQSAFSKKNIEIMQQNGYGWPKDADFGPMPFQLSKGSIPSVNATFDGSDVDPGEPFADNLVYFFQLYKAPSDGTINTVGDFSKLVKAAAGLSVDKFQLTFVLVAGQTQGNFVSYYPRFFRIECDTASTASPSSMLPSYAMIATTAYLAGDTDLFNLNFNFRLYGAAVILSYYDYAKKRWCRSTEFLASDPTFMANLALPETYDSCVRSFMDASSQAEATGRVYLDGASSDAPAYSGGDGGIDIDISTLPVNINGTVSSTLHITGAVYTTVGSYSVMAVTLSDNSTHALTGGETLNTYGKAFTSGGTQVSLTQSQTAAAVQMDIRTEGGINLMQWASQEFGVPASLFMVVQ